MSSILELRLILKVRIVLELRLILKLCIILELGLILKVRIMLELRLIHVFLHALIIVISQYVRSKIHARALSTVRTCA